MTVHFEAFPDRESAAAQLADQIGQRLTAGIAANGRASLAVSGGTTPVALFQRLSTMDLNWSQVVVTLVDERWVAPTDEDSNEGLVQSHLLKAQAAAATFIGLKNEAATASAGEKECERRLKEVPRPFDVLILGMGGDGHTASLFPGAAKLARATDMGAPQTCMGIAPLSAPHERMTLTLPAILDAAQIFLHITGSNKRDVLAQAQTDGPPEKMPIRYILRQQATPVFIYWAP
ncbi:MAG: 6-phosphogluconolactonase [Desulfobacterales bacterium]|nr:6-phosphogluconolactonase [Desulfobacterales bacterium]